MTTRPPSPLERHRLIHWDDDDSECPIGHPPLTDEEAAVLLARLDGIVVVLDQGGDTR